MPNSSFGRFVWTLGGAATAGTAVGVAAGAAALAGGYTLWRRSQRYELRGKTVLITGGSRGMGFAAAREFLRQGARVALCARNSDELDRAVAQLGAHGHVMAVRADLTEREAAARVVAEVAAQWGPVDVLAHVAGVIQIGPWQAMTQSDYEQAMGTHFWAALWLAQAVLPQMIARRHGRIVNISSIGGVVAVPHMLPYSASKFALVGLSQGLAAEVRRYGVRVSCVCPFLTRTGSQEKVLVRGQQEKEFAWFATSGSTPVLTQSARVAARAIVRAAQYGPAQVTLSLPGKLAALAHGVAPSLVAGAMGVANRLLPEPTGSETGERLGAESYNGFTERAIRPQIVRAGRELNQQGFAPASD
ncbi:MAG TPA: SDR family oxidoreductase [Terriglobales bacterium]|jgi:NAD(P)-dependent dehydrogenase (short-subunit alcohol dehydrogenase family)